MQKISNIDIRERDKTDRTDSMYLLSLKDSASNIVIINNLLESNQRTSKISSS